MNKKLIAALSATFAAVLALSLTACGSSDTNSSSSNTSSSSSSTTAASENLRFITGDESGTYYAYGSVLAQYATNGNYGVSVTLLTSDGSQENVKAIEHDNADIAFCQSDVMAFSYNGPYPSENEEATEEANGTDYRYNGPEPCKDFSVVANLYQEQVQIVTCNPDIKSVADLKGKTISVGAENSGVYFNALAVLSAYDLTIDDITPVYQSFSDSADSLKDDKIDAAVIIAGAPTTAITDLSAAKTVYLVGMDDEHVEKLLDASPHYSKSVISTDVYGLDSDVTTVSLAAVVIANNSVSEDAIYGFTKSLFEGAEKNTSAHEKYKELDIKNASSITAVPYHPGAAKYYKEQGITVE